MTDNRTLFINSCIDAGFTAQDSRECWDKAQTLDQRLSLAQNMTGHAAGLGGTDERRSHLANAAYIILRDIRDSLT